MATPLDFGLLGKFETLFPFLFILVLVYAVLTRFSTFKDKPAFAAIVAFILAVITMTSKIAVKTIALMAPWFVLVFVLAIFILIFYQLFGIEEKTILEVMKGEEYSSFIAWWIIILSLIIGVGSFSKAMSEEQGFLSLTNATVKAANEQSAFFETLTHPKVLGLVAVLLIAMLTISHLSKKAE